jgi:hypothetical protein
VLVGNAYFIWWHNKITSDTSKHSSYEANLQVSLTAGECQDPRSLNNYI